MAARTLEDAIFDFLKLSRVIFPNTTPKSSLNKMLGELDELDAAIQLGIDINREHLLEEGVDAFQCWVKLMDDLGFNIPDIIRGMDFKTDKNSKRKWIQNPDGSYSHDKSQWEDQK